MACIPFLFSFFLYYSGTYRDLLSFPTRRSSDLSSSHTGREDLRRLRGVRAASATVPVATPWRTGTLVWLGPGPIEVLMPSGTPPPHRTDARACSRPAPGDRKSTRLNSSHVASSYAVFCLNKKI